MSTFIQYTFTIILILDIKADFRTNLEELILLLLSRENLVPKKINNETVDLRELVAYLGKYVEKINDEQIPSPKGITAVRTNMIDPSLRGNDETSTIHVQSENLKFSRRIWKFNSGGFVVKSKRIINPVWKLYAVKTNLI